jgi:hypothetical protein
MFQEQLQHGETGNVRRERVLARRPKEVVPEIVTPVGVRQNVSTKDIR